jgi:FkbM family methyltransferase
MKQPSTPSGSHASKRSAFSLRTALVGLLRRTYFSLSYRFQLEMGWKPSFAQMGEDLIILSLFETMGIAKPTYLDVGAFNPYRYSNTALLYLRGSRGINVEPNPQLIAAFQQVRPRDINLNLGIADNKGELDYYMLSVAALNTFSRESAESLVRDGYSIVAIEKIPVWTLTDVVESYCAGRFPDFLSIDIEGLELPIFNTIDYDKSSPLVICAETLAFSPSRKVIKNHELIGFLEGKGYFVYADTHINTLFVKSEAYHAH